MLHTRSSGANIWSFGALEVQSAGIYQESVRLGMPKISVVGVVGAVMLLCCANQSFAQTSFKPPEIISATDIPYPIQSIADGGVVIAASLGDKGPNKKPPVVRDFPPLPSPAISAIRT